LCSKQQQILRLEVEGSLIKIGFISIPRAIIESRKAYFNQLVDHLTLIGEVIYRRFRTVRYWRKSMMTCAGSSPSLFHGCRGESVEYPRAMAVPPNIARQYK
jgi:hypothetical protein